MAKRRSSCCRFLIIMFVLCGLSAREAQAYEWGLGLGRLHGCLGRLTDQEAVCAMGPAVSTSLGFNLWGKDYRTKDHEASSVLPSSSTNFYFGGNIRVDRWEELVLVIALALFMTSVGYALLYPFSSRADIGLIGRSGWQQSSGADLSLWRNEAGVYFRAYLSQHFPLYIYANGLISQQNIKSEGLDESHQVFVKGLGLGLMSPEGAGPYLHGVWERSTLLDPGPQDLLKDTGEIKIIKNSISEILDGSYVELGYLWYL